MQRWISIGALLLGCAAFGVVIYVQETPRAFTTTHPVMVLPVHVEPNPGPIATPITEPEPATTVELPVVYVTADTPAVQPKSAGAPAAPAAPLEPCSAWHEIGPEYVTDGVATGSRRVRDLC